MSEKLQSIYLNDFYNLQGAKFAPFSGYSMPINFSKGKPEGWCGTKNPEIAGPCEAAPEEGETAATNWVNLFSLFVMLLVVVIALWVLYDIIKDSTQMKKQGSPIKDHLKNLKKPAKGTRASRKKATSKKKATRKKKS